MGLAVTKIEYANFRNYERFALEDIGGLTLFVGPNAVGKTNLIEGIQLTTAMNSFRNPKRTHLIKDGASASCVKTLIEDESRSLEVKLAITPESKDYFLNGKKKKAHSLRGLLPAVLFCPDDLELVKGSQSIKRASLDQLGSQLSANYYAVRRDYEKILRQKNRYLKEETSHAYLQSINEVLAQIGAHLYCLRVQLVQELVPFIEQCYSELTEGRERLEVSYVPSWVKYSHDSEHRTSYPVLSREEAKQTLLDCMESEYVREHERRIALFGPHADAVDFFITGRNAGIFASQGQQRSLVLSFKMAEVKLIRERLGQYPVLMLDDVMSELDEKRRLALLSLISGNVQTFISATDESYFDADVLAEARVVRLPLKGDACVE